MTQETDENASHVDIRGGKAPITMDSKKMAWGMPHTMPIRPGLSSQQSNSLPSTPYQHARQLTFTSRSPSPTRAIYSTSPRSTHSDSSHPISSLRPALSGCKYEAGMAYSRRRMPYTLGGDLLERVAGPLKEHLDLGEAERLEQLMLKTYHALLPSEESEQKRAQFLQKLEKILNERWPGKDIKVHVFGSSGNKLCSSDSDVDVCITTSYKELEHVCILAEALAQHGMQKVVCVSTAKVPIVKIWDPEMEIACDMNVNNTLALENTRMIRTYIDIDERVRPLAMLVKYWTKRRIVNDAALGGTLSSYTWICMIINFLQTRNPAVLPALQQRPHKQEMLADGTVTSFDDDMEKLHGFGSANKESLAELFFQFYRYYGYDINYEDYVVSVRSGELIGKKDKGWHIGQNNRLCVEEPFNTTRNLGNTADDSSFRGLHLELRRGFGAIAKGDLDELFEQYEFPREEERIFERPPPQPRPVLTHSISAQGKSHGNGGGRGGGRGGRGGRHGNQNDRGTNHNTNHNGNQNGPHGNRNHNDSNNHTGTNTRRPSNASTRNNNFRHNNGGLGTDAAMQAQHAQQAQVLLHDHLFQQIQFLQAQEQELRYQLQQQALLNGRSPPVLRQPYLQVPYSNQDGGHEEVHRARSGTINHPPLSAPLRQQTIPGAAQFVQAVQSSSSQRTTNNPPSPSLHNLTGADLRRNPRRLSFQNGNPAGSLRAHSQPARPVASHLTLQNLSALPQKIPRSDNSQAYRSRRPSSPSRVPAGMEFGLPGHAANSLSRQEYYGDRQPSEYIGYYVGGSPQLQGLQQSGLVSPLHNLGLALRNGSLNPYFQYGYWASTGPSSAEAATGSSRPSSSERTPSPPTKPLQRSATGPLIVNGSVAPQESRKERPKEAYDMYIPPAQSNSIPDDLSEAKSSYSETFPAEMPTMNGAPTGFHGFADPAYPLRTSPKNTSDVQSTINHGFANGQEPSYGLCESQSPPRQQHRSDQPTPEYLASQAEAQGRKHDHRVHTNNGHMYTDQDHRDARTNIAAMHNPSILPLLSPVKEVRTPSPNTARNGFSAEMERRSDSNGIMNKSKPIFKAEPRATPALHTQDRQATSRKPNGTNHGTNPTHDKSQMASHNASWQTSKRKKRTPKSGQDANSANLHGGEPLPTNEYMRKGG